MSNTMDSGRVLAGEEAAGSAVSWAAVLAGAFVGSAFSIALMALGAVWGSSPSRPGRTTMLR